MSARKARQWEHVAADAHLHQGRQEAENAGWSQKCYNFYKKYCNFYKSPPLVTYLCRLSSIFQRLLSPRNNISNYGPHEPEGTVQTQTCSLNILPLHTHGSLTCFKETNIHQCVHFLIALTKIPDTNKGGSWFFVFVCLLYALGQHIIVAEVA